MGPGRRTTDGAKGVRAGVKPAMTNGTRPPPATMAACQASNPREPGKAGTSTLGDRTRAGRTATGASATATAPRHLRQPRTIATLSRGG
eukprot:12425407-Heterocapsa_arctica.AAC.1